MNPEFERNLWLEASPRRLGWAAVVLVLVFGAVAVVTPEADKLKALSICGGVIFFAAAFIWGPRNAGQTVLVEIGQRTWDFQRLSSLTPFAMTWGKLFGATVLAWGVGVVGLLVLLLDPAPSIGSTALRAIGIGVLVQALTLAAALIGVRKARAEGRQPSLRSILGGGIGVLVVIWALAGGSRLLGAAGQAGGLGQLLSLGKGAITWWGLSFQAEDFATVAALVFAAWAFVAAWRLMRLELQMRNAPWLWAGFLVFLAVFIAGFIPDDSRMFGATAFLRWAAAAFIFVAAAYAGAFIEPADRVRLAGFGAAAKRGDWSRAYLMTPLTLAPLIMATLALVAVAFFSGDMVRASESIGRSAGMLREMTPTLVAAGFVFLLRDIGVIVFFRFGPRPRRGDFGAILALILLYWVLPLFGAAGAGSGAGMLGLALFAPAPGHATVSLVSGGLQALAIWAFSVKRLRGPDPAA